MIAPMNGRFDTYRGEFRYVFYALPGLYEQTLRFYAEVLAFPVVGGFPGGTYLRASTGVIEVIDPEIEDDDLATLVLRGHDRYSPPQGGFLLIEVPDVDALASRVRDHGVSLSQEPRDWPWKFRDFKVTDPCGTIVCLFSRLRGWEPLHGEEPSAGAL